MDSLRLNALARITSKPMKISPRAASTQPAVFIFSFFAAMKIIAPINAVKANISAIGNELNEMISAVTVVPILAPIMIHVAWKRLTIPALTSPKSITVVADEDCKTAALPTPTPTAASLLLPSFLNSSSILPPAIPVSDEEIRRIPIRNAPIPEKRRSMYAVIHLSYDAPRVLILKPRRTKKTRRNGGAFCLRQFEARQFPLRT